MNWIQNSSKKEHVWLASQYTTVGILRKKMSFNSTLGRETRHYIVSLRKINDL